MTAKRGTDQDAGKVVRARIIAESATSFAKIGAYPAAINDVAASIGVVPEGVRYWFPTEVELLGALMRARQETFMEELALRFNELDDSRSKLRAMFELAVADYDAKLWLELWRLSLHDEGAREIWIEIVGRYRELLARLIRRGRDSGEFRPRTVDGATLTLMALIDGLSLHATVGDRAAPPLLMLDRCVSLAERLLGCEL